MMIIVIIIIRKIISTTTTTTTIATATIIVESYIKEINQCQITNYRKHFAMCSLLPSIFFFYLSFDISYKLKIFFLSGERLFDQNTIIFM